MTGELVVPVLISLGLMTLMLKALAFPEFRLQRAHARSSARLGSSGRLQSSMSIMNPQRSFVPPPTVQDERVEFIEALRRSLARYQDCRVALADNYLSRASDETQSVWEFTNYWYGFKAAFDFNPDHPTSLIYQRDSQGEYRLIGAAYTAPERFSAEQRKERIPEHVAQWEPHGMFGWVARIYFRSDDMEQKKAS